MAPGSQWTPRWREADSNFQFLEDSVALVVQLDPAVSGEFHRIASRHLDGHPT
jgi:hypothetical protein